MNSFSDLVSNRDAPKEVTKGCIETGQEIDEYLGMGEIDPDDEI